jgi:hypothetical protein
MEEFYINLISRQICTETKSARHYELWSPHEDAFLARSYLTGTPYSELADLLQRRYTAIFARLCELGVLWYTVEEKAWLRNGKIVAYYSSVKTKERVDRNEPHNYQVRPKKTGSEKRA